MKNYVQPGKIIPYTNASGATIPSGSLVALGIVLGVVAADIPDGEDGDIGVVGVFDLPKAAGAVSAGDLLSFDASEGNVTTALGTPAAGDIEGCAIAIADAASADATVTAMLLPGGGSVPASG